MWGIVEAAGTGSRIQPLAFSKEYVDVGTLHGYREAIRLLGETRPAGGVDRCNEER